MKIEPTLSNGLSERERSLTAIKKLQDKILHKFKAASYQRVKNLVPAPKGPGRFTIPVGRQHQHSAHRHLVS